MARFSYQYSIAGAVPQIARGRDMLRCGDAVSYYGLDGHLYTGRVVEWCAHEEPEAAESWWLVENDDGHPSEWYAEDYLEPVS